MLDENKNEELVLLRCQGFLSPTLVFKDAKHSTSPRSTPAGPAGLPEAALLEDANKIQKEEPDEERESIAHQVLNTDR